MRGGLKEDVDDNHGGRTSKHDNFHVVAELKGHESEVKGLAWNNTESILASCSQDKTIWLWECYLPDTVRGGNSGGGGGGGIVVGNAHMAEDGEFKCLAVLQGHDGDVKCVAFGPSHSQFGNGWGVPYIASYNDTVRVWAIDRQ